MEIRMVEIKNVSGEVIFRCEGSSWGNFGSADLSRVNFKGAVLEGANFCNANLSDACLEDCNLYWGLFFGTNMQRANLRAALLMGADLKEANLSFADLSDTNLGRDNLGGSTQLEGANLSNCKIDGTIFDGAIYNEKTILPEGLNPEAHGMIFAPSKLPSS
jgi:uncharacterized protein YjbI with pentapeptide repeats